MIRTPSGVQEVGKCDHRSEVTVTATPQGITLSTGKNSIEILPGVTETEEIYFGGSGVASTSGAPLGAGKIWGNCKSTFSVYLVCAAGKTAKVRIAEYE